MHFFHGTELSKLISKNNVSLPEPTLLSYNPKTIFYHILISHKKGINTILILDEEGNQADHHQT